MNSKFFALAATALAAGTLMMPHETAQAQAAAATQMSRFDTSVFVMRPNVFRPRLSPDGTKLAYVMGKSGTGFVVIQDLNAPGSAPKVVMMAKDARESGDRTVGNFRWIGNGHLVITIAMFEDLGSGPNNFTRLVAYDLATGKLVQQAWDNAGGGAADILQIDHDKGQYLLQRDSTSGSTERWGFPQVVRVDVRTGKFNIVQNTNPEIQSWVADGTGVVRAGLGGDGDTGKERLMYRSTPKDTLKTVQNSADKTFTGGQPEPQLFIPGTDMAYATSRKDGFTKVYKMNMKTMDLGQPLFETPGFDVQGIIPNRDGTDILGYETFDGEMKTVWTDPVYKEVHGLAEELFGKGQVDLVDISKAKNRAVLVVGGLNKHPGFYVYDMVSGKMRLLNWVSSTLKDSPMNPVKAEWYTARDGTKIQAVVTYPRHRKGKKLPVVILPHGGPFGVISATNQNEPWGQPLAEAGYVVIQPNYRGSGGYGRAFQKLGRQPDGYGKKMQDDLNDILTFYGNKGIIDPNRACIMGWSYGGYAAARGAQRDGNIWKCAIAGAGVYDMAMMNRWDANNLGNFSSKFQDTSDDPDGISSAKHTDGKWAPILIVAGARDRRIPLEQSRTLVSRLKNSGKKEGVDFKYIEQKQGTHNLPYDDLHVQWIVEAETWLTRFNPAYIASDTDKAPATIIK